VTAQLGGRDGRAEILIIGAGPAGAVAALRLAQEGLAVVVLEQGYWHDRVNYRGSAWDWELAADKPWSTFPASRQSPADYPIDASESDMSVMNFNGVGGSSIIYNANWMRLPDYCFRARTLWGVADDWPLNYADLAPFYDRTDGQIGISGLPGNPAYPPLGEPQLLPPMPVRAGGLKVARELHKRRWHWWPDTSAILSTPYDGRHPCAQRGTCTNGCNEGAKGSADVTHWDKAVLAGARLVTGARVSRITLDAAGLANGAEWIDDHGRTNFQSADVVLMAANGVGTPRLLLNSACTQFPTGLANRSGQLGRNLMLHPTCTVMGLFHDPLESWQGHYGASLHTLEFGANDPSRGFLMGAKWALHNMGGGPLADAMRVFEEFGHGGDHHRHFAEWFGHGQRWSVIAEDLPEESNRVVLSPDLKDSSGLPAPKLLYRISENTQKNLAWNTARAAEVLRAAGAWKVVAQDALRAAHLMGTARMGIDARTSVVDRWCMAHDIPNLGILDGSVFVTSGPVNPTSTICALALRTAERLIDIRSNLPTPTHATLHPALPPPKKKEIASPEMGQDVPLTEQERRRLSALADVIIPAADPMPAAGSVVATERMLSRICTVRTDLVATAKAIVGRSYEAPGPMLDALKTSDPGNYRSLLVLVAGAYYSDPVVKELIGYPGQVADPHRPDNYPTYLAEGLLDHLIKESA
jgi:choline dehydrogenase-like flavoprotein